MKSSKQSKAVPLLLLALGGVPTLNIYTYDSLAAEWGLGPVLKKQFEAKAKAKLQFVTFGSAGEALNQITLEGKNTRADIILGLDNSLLYRAKKTGLFSQSKTSFVPFDYGFLGIVYDSDRVKGKLPLSLKEFAQNQNYKKRFSLIDPRTSSVGLGFLYLTHALFPKKSFEQFWKSLSAQILTISPGWSGAYALFTQKKADFVLSYTTSPAYHIENDKKQNIRALIFKEGHYRQEEYVGVIASGKQPALSKQFIEMLLSPEIQKQIPTTQWMYPVNKGVALPQSFRDLPVPKAIEIDHKMAEDSRMQWLKEWEGFMVTS